jgi:hypothetical protein
MVKRVVVKKDKTTHTERLAEQIAKIKKVVANIDQRIAGESFFEKASKQFRDITMRVGKGEDVFTTIMKGLGDAEIQLLLRDMQKTNYVDERRAILEKTFKTYVFNGELEQHIVEMEEVKRTCTTLLDLVFENNHYVSTDGRMAWNTVYAAMSAVLQERSSGTTSVFSNLGFEAQSAAPAAAEQEVVTPLEDAQMSTPEAEPIAAPTSPPPAADPADPASCINGSRNKFFSFKS